MSNFDRRDFIKTGAGMAALSLAQSSRVLGANDRVRVAIIGLRGRGNDHINGPTVPGVELAAICDIDDSTCGANGRDRQIEASQTENL